MPTVQVSTWGDAIFLSLTNALNSFLAAIPLIIGALVIIIIGWIIAGILARIVTGLLRRAGADRLFAEHGGDVYGDQSRKVQPSVVGGELVKWLVRIIFLVAAANVLGMTQVSTLLNQVLLWIPNLIVAAVILLVAPIIARFVRDAIEVGAGEMGFTNGRLLGRIAEIAIVAFAVIIAVNQIGIATNLVDTLFIGLVAALRARVRSRLRVGRPRGRRAADAGLVRARCSPPLHGSRHMSTRPQPNRRRHAPPKSRPLVAQRLAAPAAEGSTEDRPWPVPLRTVRRTVERGSEMAPGLNELATWSGEHLNVVIETPKDQPNKLTYDPEAARCDSARCCRSAWCFRSISALSHPRWARTEIPLDVLVLWMRRYPRAASWMLDLSAYCAVPSGTGKGRSSSRTIASWRWRQRHRRIEGSTTSAT